MPTLDCIVFNTSGWTPEEATDDLIAWTNEAGDRLEYRISNKSPVLPALYPIDLVQKFAGEHWQNDSTALISVDVLSVRGMSIVRSVLKHRLSDEQHSYHGRIHLPFRDFSYEIRVKMAAVDAPTPREGKIHAELASDESWDQAPYHPAPAGYLCCRADHEQFDEQFPQDSLTLLRLELVKIIASLQTIREVRNSIPFQGNA